MAGEWIKVELCLPQKPEVIRLGRALGMSPQTVCGWLITFWGWIGSISVDGVVDGVVAADVDMVMSLPGFADALVAVKWLRFEVDHSRLIVPNFERHNGESAKKRALKTSRQARWRDTQVDGVVDAHVDAPVVRKPPPEKRREEVKEAEPTGSTMVWNHGLKLLQAQGMPEQEARSFIGMLLGKYDGDVVLDAMQSAAGKTDAKSYVLAILKNKPFKGEKKMRVAL